MSAEFPSGKLPTTAPKAIQGLYADAVMVASEKRYNDGSSVRENQLEPFDGIILDPGE